MGSLTTHRPCSTSVVSAPRRCRGQHPQLDQQTESSAVCKSSCRQETDVGSQRVGGRHTSPRNRCSSFTAAAAAVVWAVTAVTGRKQFAFVVVVASWQNYRVVVSRGVLKNDPTTGGRPGGRAGGSGRGAPRRPVHLILCSSVVGGRVRPA